MPFDWRHALLLYIKLGRVLPHIHTLAIFEGDFAWCQLIFRHNFEKHGSVWDHLDFGDSLVRQNLMRIVVADESFELVVQNVVLRGEFAH